MLERSKTLVGPEATGCSKPLSVPRTSRPVRLVEQLGEELLGGIAQQVPVHAERIVEEIETDLGVHKTCGQEVQRLRLVEEGLGVDDPLALSGFPEQPDEVLDGEVVLAGQLRAPGKLGKGESDVTRKPFVGTLRVTSPARQSLASGRKRVLRGAGVTRAAKRRQRVSGPCD